MSETFRDYEYVDVGSLNPVPLPESTVLVLSELAAKYADCVPLRFRVVNGFMAENAKDPTIGVDEVYTLHLVRELKVVVVKHVGDEFEIPVNSTAKFGLVPHGGTAFLYGTVGDIISAKNSPKVVSVKSNYVHPEGLVSLQKNEVLVIRDVVKSKFGRSKLGLRVYSITSCKELVLPKDCDAQFSTDPEATKLYLTDMLESGIDFIPCSVQMFPGENSALSGLHSSVISIERQEVHRSVVISLFRDNPNAKQKKDTNFIDIPTTIRIRASVIETKKSDEIYEQIFKQSKDLLTCYNPSKIQACVDAHTDDQYMTQAQLLAEIRKEKAKTEMAGAAPQQYQELLAKTIQQDGSYQPWSTPETKRSQPKSSNSLQLPPKQIGHIGKQFRQPPPLPSTAKQDAGSLTAEGASQKDVVKKLKVPPPVPKKNAVYEELKSHHRDTGLKARVDPPTVRSHLREEMVTDVKPPLSVSTTSDTQLRSPADRGDHQGVHRIWATEREAHHVSGGAGTVSEASEYEGPEAVTNISRSAYVKFSKSPQLPSLSNVPTSKLELLSEQMNSVQMTLLTIMKQIGDIQTRQSTFEKELQAMKSTSKHAEPIERSCIISADMSPADVQRAVSAAGLSQYQESFAREAVDGEMFLMLDDEILCNELGVNSKLHRVRFMRMKGTEN